MTTKKLTPIQSIKKYCRYDCCANDTMSWKNCSRPACPLFPYRLGKRPVKMPFEAYTTKKRKSIEKQAVLMIETPKNDDSMDTVEVKT